MRDIAEAVSTANKFAVVNLLCKLYTAKHNVGKRKKLAEKKVILESV